VFGAFLSDWHTGQIILDSLQCTDYRAFRKLNWVCGLTLFKMVWDSKARMACGAFAIRNISDPDVSASQIHKAILEAEGPYM
jgi:hypothetical protein